MYYGYFDPVNVVFHLLFWILFVWIVIWLIRGARRRHHLWCDGQNCGHPSHGGRALDVLKERFAKGEINKEEYEEKKNTLLK